MPPYRQYEMGGSKAGPSRDRADLGMKMKWTPELTADLLELIGANKTWRHSFFSQDAYKWPMWKEARDVLCLLCRRKEHGLMRAMERQGLVEARSESSCGAILWRPTKRWDRADAVTNRAESHLRRLKDEYKRLQAQYYIPVAVSIWEELDPRDRAALERSHPYFMTVHNLHKNAQVARFQVEHATRKARAAERDAMEEEQRADTALGTRENAVVIDASRSPSPVPVSRSHKRVKREPDAGSPSSHTAQRAGMSLTGFLAQRDERQAGKKRTAEEHLVVARNKRKEVGSARKGK